MIDRIRRTSKIGVLVRKNYGPNKGKGGYSKLVMINSEENKKFVQNLLDIKTQ